MNIRVNGEKKDVQSTTIMDLFQELAVNPRGIGVHVNGVFVHWTKYPTWQIQNQDEIELVRFIAGG